MREEPAPTTEAAVTGTDGEATDIADSLTGFIETVTEALATAGASEPALTDIREAGETLTTEVANLVADRARLRERVATLEETTAELAAETEQLQAELETERETRAKEAAEDRKRLHELETAVDDSGGESPATSPPEAPSQPAVDPPKTPLEDVIRVPEHLVAESLTANQERARFVAKDVHEYTQRVPAGRAIKSSELRRVLTAGEDATIHTETVSRVMEFLDELGQDAVQIREANHGERVVVFTEAFVTRVKTWQHHGQDGNHAVVTGEEVSG